MNMIDRTAFLPSTAHRVLVVDDEPQVRRLLSRQLELLGCAADFATSASGFLAKLANPGAIYDLAIIDINLPGLDGRNIITWMRESDQSTIRCLPVLIITGYSDRIPPEFIDGIGHCKLLAKPFTQGDLRDSISEHAGRCH